MEKSLQATALIVALCCLHRWAYRVWLKVHYTAEFFCRHDGGNGDTDKLKVLHRDALSMASPSSHPT
jgi:hypothetical protein